MTSNVIPFDQRLRADGLYRFGSVLRPEDRAVYTVKEVSQLLAVSLGGTYALVRAGRIPAIKLGGRWVIPKRRFHAWLEQCLDGEPEEWR